MKNKLMRLLQRTLRRLNLVKEKITGIILFKRKKELLEEIQKLVNINKRDHEVHVANIKLIHDNYGDNLAKLLKIQQDVSAVYIPNKQVFTIEAKVDPHFMTRLSGYDGYKEHFVDNLCRRLKRDLMNANFYIYKGKQ